MARIVFYCRDTLENIHSMEYYRQDISALRGLGHEVVVCNRYRDIPRQFDVMFVWWWTYALVPVLLAKVRGRPSIVTGVFNFRFDNQTAGTDYFGRPWFQRALIALATKLADANLFVSSREFEDVPKHFGLRRAHYAPCAVGDAYFAADKPGAARTLLLNLAWSGTENLHRKGVWTILEAAALLRSRGRRFEMVLAGKRGDGFDDLVRKVADLDVGDCVRVVGEVTFEEKLDLFGRTKIYLQPSRFEGFGLATAEAMAAGCCVITTDVGEVRTVVGDAGMYVPPGDATALADAIDELLDAPEKADDFRARAAARIQQRFSAARKTTDLKSVLVDLGV